MFNILIYQKNASQKDIEMLLDPSQKGSHGENNLGLPRWLSRKKHLLQSLIICLVHVVEGTIYHKWSSDPHTCAARCGHMFAFVHTCVRTHTKCKECFERKRTKNVGEEWESPALCG